MSTKSSAHYQREYRKRLREQGLVKREVWILPENTQFLSQLEKQLRNRQSSDTLDNDQIAQTPSPAKSSKIWTTERLFSALQASDFCTVGSASIAIIEGVDPTIHMTMHEYGDLSVFLVVAGEQIIVESILWSTEEIVDISAFNEAVLRTHKYFPLSTISLDKMNDSKDYYHMFGALSSRSLLENILFEIEVLANNVIQAVSGYGEFLKETQQV